MSNDEYESLKAMAIMFGFQLRREYQIVEGRTVAALWKGDTGMSIEKDCSYWDEERYVRNKIYLADQAQLID